MELHAAGHVPGVRADEADPHRGRRHRPAAVGQVVQPERLQHVPVLRVRADRRAEHVGDLLGHGRDLLTGAARRRRRRPRRGTGSPAGAAAHRRRSYQMLTGSSAAPVRSASTAGPGGIRVGSPSRSTGTPRARRSRSASSGTSRPARSRRRQRVEQVAVAAGQRQDLHARGPRGRRGSGRSSRSGRSRSATVVTGAPVSDGPGAGVVPVAHVRQRGDHAPRPAPSASRRWCSSSTRTRPTDPVAAPVRQPERVAPVAQVGAQPGPGQRPQLVVRRVGPGPAQVAPPAAAPPPAPAPDQVGDQARTAAYATRSGSRRTSGPRRRRRAR